MDMKFCLCCWNWIIRTHRMVWVGRDHPTPIIQVETPPSLPGCSKLSAKTITWLMLGLLVPTIQKFGNRFHLLYILKENVRMLCCFCNVKLSVLNKSNTTLPIKLLVTWENKADGTSQRSCSLGHYLWYDPTKPLGCQKLFTSDVIKL